MKAPYSRVRTLFAAMLALAGTPLLYSQDAVAAVHSRGRQIPLDGNSALTVPLDALPLEIQVVKDGRVVSRCELNAAKSAKSERHYDLTLTTHETGWPFSVYSTPFLSGETVTGGFGGGSGEHFNMSRIKGNTEVTFSMSERTVDESEKREEGAEILHYAAGFLVELNVSPALERPVEIWVRTTERVLRAAPPSYPVDEDGFMVSLPGGRTYISKQEVEERITRRVRGCVEM